MHPLEPAREGAVTLSSQRDRGNDEQCGGNENDHERSLGHGRGFEWFEWLKEKAYRHAAEWRVNAAFRCRSGSVEL
jgi:hypothetical protein